jgi:hypothetical protein
LVHEPQPGAINLDAACLGIRFFVGCALIIPMIIQTILLDPSGAVWTDKAFNLSRLDPSGAVQADAEHPTRNRVEGSNPTSGSIALVKGYQARRAHSAGSGGGNLST